MKNRYGLENVVSAYVHMDGSNTAYALCFVL
ncbi:plasmid recombination protein [Intestinimonas butyriciproducens]|nr:plasmid recombination protein [Intestinimonas butyriciproducens]